MDRNRYFEDEAIEQILQESRLVVFDLNGLILNDEPLQLAAVNAVLEKYGIQFDEATWIQRFFGRRSADYFLAIMEANGRESGPDLIKSLVAEKDRRYRGMLGQHLHDCTLRGAVEFIGHLHRHGRVALALATSASKEELTSVMGTGGLGLLQMFRHVVCGEDVNRGKPDPETYVRVAALSGVAPSSALVLEDSAIGVQAAAGAGMRVVAVPNRFTASQDFTGAHLIISDLTPQANATSMH